MISKIRVTILFFCFLFSCKDNNAGPLLNGIDVFFNQNLDEYSGEKVALVLNHTSVNRNGRSLLDLSQEKLNVVAIFTPEHGLFGTAEAGKKIDDNTYQGISVFSLYGKNKAPTSKQLQGIDLILFDMQDIGSRYYTYISTLSHVMKSASDNDIKVVILDRVNPIGRKIEGPTLKYEHSSFVGMHPVPIRHGLTIGEFSNMIAELNWMEFSYRPRLEIIPVSGWNGGYSDITTKPSPNIEDLEAALIYTGMCLLEGTNLSEGRGTNTPFKLFGAPWMNSDEVINKVGNLNGVELSSVNFTPMSMPGKSKYPKFQNQLCNGISIRITDMEQFEPIMLAVKILKAVYELHPDDFKILDTNFIDKLYGSDALKNNIISNSSIDELIVTWSSDSKEFESLSRKFRIY